jgi:hypothetical protein
VFPAHDKPTLEQRLTRTQNHQHDDRKDGEVLQAADEDSAGLVEDSAGSFPVVRGHRGLNAVAAVRGSSERKRGEELAGAIRTALRETAFRFQLVMAINVKAHELIDRAVLVQAAPTAHFSLLMVHEPAADQANEARRFTQCLEIADRQVTELMAAAEGRVRLEARYLGGPAALFPDGATAFDAQLLEAQRLVVMATRLAELDGIPFDMLSTSEAVTGRADDLVTDLVEPARATALEKLDENRRAAVIAARWLRQRASPDRETASDIATR